MRVCRYIMLFLLLLTTAPAWALEGPYYFKNGGNDGNTGLSDAQAWADPSVMLDGQSFDAGTDFYFKQDDTFTVTNDIDINHSGVNGANKSIIGCYEGDSDFDCSGARPIIQTSVTNGSVFKLNNDNSYLTFKDLNIRNSSAGDTWQDVGGVGIGTIDDGSGGNGDAGYLTITNCNFYHHGHYSIGLARMGNYNIITDNTFTEVGNAIYWVDEYTAGGSSYNYFADNTATDIIGYKGVDGHLVGLQRVSYSIIEDNTVTNGYNTPLIAGTWGEAPSVYNVFRRNKVYSSYSAAILLGGGPNDCAYGYLAYQNISTNSSTGSPRGAFYFSNADMTSIGHRMFNNTAYNAFNGGVFLRASASNTLDYVYYKNNIAVLDGHTGGYDLFVRVEEKVPPGAVGGNFFCDYNLYWSLAGDPSAAVKWMDTNVGYYDWSDWTTARNNDANSPSPADPAFTDAGSNDFTLQTGSPAIDTGFYLSYVSEAGNATTTVNVADSYWFHGDYGLVDENGDAITGMEITLYDTTNGHQNVTITSDAITHGTPGSFVVDAAVDYIYDSENLTNPANTTQIALTFYGTKPDIGAEEYNLNISDPLPQGDGTSITAGLSFTKPTGQTDADVHFKAGSTPCTFDGGDLVKEGDVESVSNGDCGGPFAYETDYCWQVTVNPDTDAVVNGPYYFGTATQQNPPKPSGAILSHAKKGAKGIFLKKGLKVGQ